MNRATAVLSIVVLAACAAAGQRGATAPRFESQRYPYAIYYDGGILGMFAVPTWRILNFDFDGKKLAPKDGIQYEVLRAYDANGDGTPEGEYTEPFYEVALQHRTKDARMWLRMVPLPVADKGSSLKALAERYVACAAGAGSPLVRFGVERSGCGSTPHASRVLATSRCSVSGKEAWQIDYEVAPVPAGQPAEGARWTRARLVLVRTGYEKTLIDAEPRVEASFPVLMLAQLAAPSADFARLEPDYERFLSQLALSPRGEPIPARGGHSCKAAATGAASSP
jgi:hypothetical protein